jgi:hypothetical protein
VGSAQLAAQAQPVQQPPVGWAADQGTDDRRGVDDEHD